MGDWNDQYHLEYDNFDLLIQLAAGENRYSARVVSSPAGSGVYAEFAFPLTEKEQEDLRRAVDTYRPGQRKTEPRSLTVAPSAPLADALNDTPQDPVELVRRMGGRLFDALFRLPNPEDGYNPVGQCLRSNLDALVSPEKADRGLRLRLTLTDTPELCGVPWEFLHDSETNSFLPMSAQTPLVRWLEPKRKVWPLLVNEPLRILVAVSNPSDHEHQFLNVQEEAKRLMEALGPLLQSGQVTCEWLIGASTTNLQRLLQSGKAYHVFHFIGHAAFDRERQEGQLIFQKNAAAQPPESASAAASAGGRPREGASDPVPAWRLGELLRDRPPRLAILNACESARAERGKVYAGVAQSLLRQCGIPALIAMQFTISDTAAITFAAAFYQSLAQGHPVDHALAGARQAILADANDLEWGTPVLYLSARDGCLFNVARTPDPTATVLDERVADEPAPGAIPAALAASVPEPIGPIPIVSRRSPFPLEDPDETMDMNSNFYIERANETQALGHITCRGVTLVLKAAGLMGRSSALRRIRDKARQCGKRTLLVEFSTLDAARTNDAREFFSRLCSRLSAEMERRDEAEAFWDANAGQGNNWCCTRYVEQYLLQNDPQDAPAADPAADPAPLVLIFDELDQLHDRPFRSDFYTMLRSWHNRRAEKPAWKNLDLVLATSADPFTFIAPPPDFDVGAVMELDEFSADQVADLNERHGEPFTKDDLNRLIALVGGHPYLVRRALFEVASGRRSAANLFDKALDDEGPFGKLWTYFFHELDREPLLLHTLKQVIARTPDVDSRHALHLAGLGLVRVRRVRLRRETTIRCSLFGDYFRELTP